RPRRRARASSPSRTRGTPGDRPASCTPRSRRRASRARGRSRPTSRRSTRGSRPGSRRWPAPCGRPGTERATGAVPGPPPDPPLLNAATHFVDRNVAEGRGAQPAYLCDDRTLTYADLLSLVNRTGNALRARGVERGERVLMTCLDGPEFLGTFWGAI